jgi:hypothetical protein
MISIFSAISVELYYIFATLWGREQYTLYGILFIVYGILLSVTACISVALILPKNIKIGWKKKIKGFFSLLRPFYVKNGKLHNNTIHFSDRNFPKNSLQKTPSKSDEKLALHPILMFFGKMIIFLVYWWANTFLGYFIYKGNPTWECQPIEIE